MPAASKSILIVDDDPAFRELVSVVLKDRDLNILEASSGKEASEIIRQNNPIMAIVDYRLPEMDGISWIKNIRESGRNLSLVFISRIWCDAKTFNWLRNILKVSLILHKPIQPDLFLQQIASLLPPQEGLILRSRPVENSLDQSAESKSNEKTAQESEVLLGQINDLRSKLERQNKLAAVKANYARGLSQSWEELSQAISTAHKDSHNAYLVNEAKLLAHRMAGTAGSVGFTKVGEEAGRIENLLISLDPTDNIQEIIWGEIKHILEEGEISIREATQTAQALIEGDIVVATNQILVYGNKDEYNYVSADKLKLTPPVCLQIADSPAAVMQLAKRNNFNALIMDLSMGNTENIFTLASDIRLLAGYETVPISFVYANNQKPNKSKLIFAGCSVLVSKPFQKVDIEKACKQLIASSPIRKLRVLIVDDNKVLTRFIASTLEEEGLAVSILNNAIDIMSTVKSFQPDLVLLDVMMPGLSGYDVCRMLRNHEQWKNLSIIFLTSRNDQEGRTAAYRAGGNDFLSKPVLSQELIIRIKTQLEQARQKNLIPDRNRPKGPLNSVDFMLAANSQLMELTKQNLPMTICLIALDDFINSGVIHGFSSAQEAIASLEKLIYCHFRTEDLRGKLAEDTFIMAFPQAKQEIITEAINKLLSEFSSIKFTSQRLTNFKATFSAGICEYPKDAKSVQNLLSVAHQRLLYAKKLYPGAIAITNEIS